MERISSPLSKENLLLPVSIWSDERGGRLPSTSVLMDEPPFPDWSCGEGCGANGRKIPKSEKSTKRWESKNEERSRKLVKSGTQ